MEPSSYQKAVLSFVETGSGNGIVKAVAGSGKTSTLVMALEKMRGRVGFFAFNKHIAETLRERVPFDVKVSTIHSLGLGTIMKSARNKPRVDDKKMSRIIKNLLLSWEERDPISHGQFERAADLCRLTLTDPTPDGIESLMDTYNSMDFPCSVARASEIVTEALRQDLLDESSVDFCDMIWWPHAKRLRPEPFDWIALDEAQDLSHAQRSLVLSALKKDGRVLAVGDPSQSVFGFSGAGIDSYDRIRLDTSAREFPLSICYRCPTSHLDLAREIVPEIEARPDAPAGIIEDVKLDDVVESLSGNGEMVICRVNAPLASIALRLIRRGVKASVRGRDFSSGLKSLIKKHGGDNDSVVMMMGALSEYLENEVVKLNKAGKESKAMALEDRVETILVLSDRCRLVDEVILRIDEIFHDDVAGVVCSSVHRAKGLEANTVVIVDEHLMPHPMAKAGWEKIQERNLRYVALTRSKNSLVFTKTPKGKIET